MNKEYTEAEAHTPNPLLPPLADGPKRTMLVEIKVSEAFEGRLDNQWEVEREIHADRWKWHWETDYTEPYKDKIEWLEHQNTQQAFELEQAAADLKTAMDQAEAATNARAADKARIEALTASQKLFEGLVNTGRITLSGEQLSILNKAAIAPLTPRPEGVDSKEGA